MKLSILLAQYFYQHKQLNLPSIGSFSLDAAVSVPDQNDKNFREFLKYVQFKQQPVAKADDTLIDYIRAHTGKIKPLAESDLESYLADGKLLLNIGKPFHIDGIGSLHKNKLGIYEFIAGEPSLERMEVISEPRETERPAAASNKKKSAFDESYSRIEAHNTRRKSLLIGTLVVIGLAVIVWGGYVLYNNNNGKELSTPPQQVVQDTSLPASDTTAKAPVDSTPVTTASTLPPGSYKFIFETTAKKARALKRHAFLLPLNKDIKLETTDSLTFNISIVLPATPADTIRLKDSLNAWYYGTKPVKVRIEQ
ncbi:hypothetical protein D3H65_03380 [Paraflavitalea soli]|uniref:CCDC81-like prokaryotic HU domain-containing protein n=1 Tax=Paraflavitalea soli TaxID=2315862 RepID=A0A3B7MFF9_9BACT|nr:hypothetical protein [Paraflavitalea soli]AXY73068.1 hypothetical protein D3H65_03380 [Paraflavitalea soli]